MSNLIEQNTKTKKESDKKEKGFLNINVLFSFLRFPIKQDGKCCVESSSFDYFRVVSIKRNSRIS